MNTSENVDKLVGALSKAQGEIEPAAKGSVNPQFKSKYADLGAVITVMKQPFAKNGLAVHQGPRVVGEQLRLVTRIMHADQWIEDDGYPLFLDKQTMQGLGSATTYARRYGLMAAAGIAPEDDDGAAAVGDTQSDGKPIDAKKTAKPKAAPPKTFDLMDAKTGALETFPATQRGALDAVARLEGMCTDNPSNWEVNSEVAAHLETVVPGLRINDGPTIKVRIDALRGFTASAAEWTSDGLLVVPVIGDGPNWALWCEQFEAEELDKAADVTVLMAKYKSTLNNLKSDNEDLSRAMVASIRAKVAALEITEAV